MSQYYYHVSPVADLTSLRSGTCVSRQVPSIARVDELMDDAASAITRGAAVYLYRVYTSSVEDRNEFMTDGSTTMVAGGLSLLTTAVPVMAPVVVA